MKDNQAPGDALYAMADLITPMAIRVAATLRIADHLDRAPGTAPELAEATGADAGALQRLLAHLTTVGVLSADPAGRYALTPVGELLRDDCPGSLRALFDIDGAFGRAELSLFDLRHSVRTGEAAYLKTYGLPFWDDLAAEPALSASFDAQVGRDARVRARAVAAAYDWGSLGHVIDVGGGNGTTLAVLLQAHPTLRGTVVDLPGTVDRAQKTLGAAGVYDRAEVVGGSFFDPLPPGAGGYVISGVLHDWDDGAARTILRRCAEAAGGAGRVFVIERIGADGEAVHTETNLRVLAYVGGGRERGVAELSTLADDAGLRVASTHRAEHMSIIELTGK